MLAYVAWTLIKREQKRADALSDKNDALNTKMMEVVLPAALSATTAINSAMAIIAEQLQAERVKAEAEKLLKERERNNPDGK